MSSQPDSNYPRIETIAAFVKQHTPTIATLQQLKYHRMEAALQFAMDRADFCNKEGELKFMDMYMQESLISYSKVIEILSEYILTGNISRISHMPVDLKDIRESLEIIIECALRRLYPNYD